MPPMIPAMAISYKSKSLGISTNVLDIGLVAFVPPYVMMIALSLPRNMILLNHVPRSSKGMAGIYKQSRSKVAIFGRIIMASWGLLARAGMLISWWVAANVLVPRLKRLTLLGSPLWRWSLLAFTIPAAYFEAFLLYVILLLFTLPVLRRIPNLYLYSGLMPSTAFVVYFGMVFGAWVGYFSTERGLKQASTPHPEAFEYVTWTLVSLLVGSLLCFFKTLFLLKWRANAIYRRFEPRILITGVKFLYLGLIVGDFFESMVIRKLELLQEYARHADSQSFSFLNFIMSKHLPTVYLQEVGHFLTSLAGFVRPLLDDGVPELLKFLEKEIRTTQICQPDDVLEILSCPVLSDRNLVHEKQLHKYGLIFPVLSRKVKKPPASDLHTAENCDTTVARKAAEEDLSPEEYRKSLASVLHCIVREQCASAADNQFTFDDLKKWMVDAHMNCVNMGRTLADASAIATRLDLFISLIIVIAVVLLWLLITGIATTTVLVTIATPLLALTFIFGDSAKTFFQGIIFCFGTHAFDVGDRCVLDDTELEVKSISILTTTFVKIGSVEKRMYPNSLLATKAIVNLGWQPDPSDTVELTLDLSTSPTAWQMLENKIQQFFDDPQQKEFFQRKHEVTMKETEDKIKVAIHFKHVLNVKEMTHGECFHKKNRQRSIILKKISHFLDHNHSPDDNGGSVNSQVVPNNDQPSITSEIMEH